MKGKKLTALAITAVMGMSVLAGCSGGSAESGKETKKTADGKTHNWSFSAQKQKTKKPYRNW